MGYASSWNLRKRGAGRIAQFLSVAGCLVLLPGCASEPHTHPVPPSPATSASRTPVDIYQLAQTEDEVTYLQNLLFQNPEWAANEKILRQALGYHRAWVMRTQALAIQFRHQYPSATEEEIAVLARDGASREARDRQDAITRSILSAPPASSGSSPVHCFSDKVFGTIYTDCY